MPEMDTMHTRLSPQALALLAELMQKTNFQGSVAKLVVEIQDFIEAQAKG